MTRNKTYLAEYQDFNGGPIAFGGKLQHFNLFSVSQMCDKKNKVLFTNSECLVLSPEFKLPDENQVLLKVPRQNNMYSFNLENIVPSGGLACLITKATTDESNKWHRRLGHVNFKNLNKLVKGNLVRGLPSKIFQNDCFVLPIWPSYSSTITPDLKTDDKREGPREEEQVFMDDLERLKRQEKEAVQRDPLFDEIPEDTVDHIETKNAQNEGRTREMVDEDKEIDEKILSTEDIFCADKEGVSTDMEKVSTDRPIVSTDMEKQNKGTEEQVESTDGHKKGTKEEVESTDGHKKGTEEEIATQATQTSTQT
ncbi:ribonuclease H-like domain-containing protein, partial [Tanacetum coccineum]